MSKEYSYKFLMSRRGLAGGFQVRQEILGALIIISDVQSMFNDAKRKLKHKGKE